MSRIYLYFGDISEEAIKHRSAIMVLSVIMLVIDPHVTLTLGAASLAGLGISVEPPQAIPVGLFLYVILFYRLIAFWVAALLGAGTNKNTARERAIDACDPTHYDQEKNIQDVGQLISFESSAIIYRWKVRRIYWDLFIPNILAMISLSIYSYGYAVDRF